MTRRHFLKAVVATLGGGVVLVSQVSATSQMTPDYWGSLMIPNVLKELLNQTIRFAWHAKGSFREQVRQLPQVRGSWEEDALRTGFRPPGVIICRDTPQDGAHTHKCRIWGRNETETAALANQVFNDLCQDALTLAKLYHLHRVSVRLVLHDRQPVVRQGDLYTAAVLFQWTPEPKT